MFSNYSSDAKANLVSRLVFPLLSVFLAVDSLNGFMMLGLGLDASLSAIYKSFLLSILMIYLCLFLPRKMIVILVAFCALSLGEIVSVFSLDTNGGKLSFLFQHILKVLSPLILFYFLIDRLKRDTDFFARILAVIKINGFIFLSNMLAGYFGLGFSTYGQGGENSVGSKGYFYAGNEISALLVVFCAFFVASAYIRNRLNYALMSILYISIGFLVSTKTAILASVLLVFLIPALYEGRRIILLNNMTSIIFSLSIMIIFIQAVVIYEAFKNTPIYSRLFFIFENNGVVGLLFSARDMFIGELWSLFVGKSYVFGIFLGHGISYYADFTKYSVEMDMLDMFFWHGLTGVATLMIVFVYLTHWSWAHFANDRYPFARIVLVTNLMLLAISNLSGHIFTSGMLAFIWPCFAILSYYDPSRLAKK